MLLDENKITSSTLIVNGPAFVEAVKNIPIYSHASFGIHLNLTQFAPLTSADIFFETNLVNEEGNFTANIRSVYPSETMKQAIYTELKEQVSRARDCGIKISHLDSHHHIHTVPWLFTILKKVQKTFNIRKVRITKNQYSINDRISKKLLLSKKLWNLALRNIYSTKTTDYFTDFISFVEQSNTGTYSVQDSAELMCHPGSNNVEEEYLLNSNWIENLPFAVELISYNQL